jgi:hypothetical protein
MEMIERLFTNTIQGVELYSTDIWPRDFRTHEDIRKLGRSSLKFFNHFNKHT